MTERERERERRKTKTETQGGQCDSGELGGWTSQCGDKHRNTTRIAQWKLWKQEFPHMTCDKCEFGHLGKQEGGQEG